MALNERERRFVDAYMGEAAGNGTEAARKAGYKGSADVLGVQAARMLAKARIAEAIAERRQALSDAGIADLQERRKRLSAIVRGEEGALAIKATDVLNKMDGAYVEKHQHDIGPTLAALLSSHGQ